MNTRENVKLNNSGLSLVELIIAISIGVIVSGSIAALISFSIRMYNNESVNTAMQYELQSNINMMMDEIMGSSAFVVVQDSTVNLSDTGKPYTKYAMFGNPNANVGGAKGFKGVIFIPGAPDSDNRFKIYMKKVEKKTSEFPVPPGGTTGTLSSLALSESSLPASDDDKVKYLLGENATQFVIIPDPQNISLDDTTDPINATYTNPIEVKIELKFEKNGWGTKKYEKHVDDITYLRNKVQDTVYVGSTPYNIKKRDE